jgi:UDP-glucose 4-epimerase
MGMTAGPIFIEPGYPSLGKAPILVTGGTGFIGRHVVRKLLAEGHSLRLPYRRSAPTEWHDDPRIELIEIEDFPVADLAPLVGGTGAIVHLAGLAHVGDMHRADLSRDFQRLNDELTGRLASAARDAGTAAFIHISSLAAITSNANAEIVSDLTDTGPVSSYGRSKRAAEARVRQLAAAGRFAISLRPPLVVGAGASGNWRSLQKLAALGLPLPFASVRNRRSFISIQSLTQAIALLCSRSWPPSYSGDYCIADPDLLSLPQIVVELRSGMGRKPSLFPCPPTLLDALGAVTGRGRQIAGLTGSLRVDSSRFATTFNFVPELSIREAIRVSGKEFIVQRSAPPTRSAIGLAALGSASSGATGQFEAAKRTVDVLLALGVGVVALPFVFLAMAVIRLTSPGPALFRQSRVGRNEQVFFCLKLRTMRQDTANAPSHEVSASAVTAVGRLLRRSKLDELPQLWNILKGEMSFVGPRPCLPTQVALIEARRAFGLYSLRPGITGVAQVAGVDMSDPDRLAALDATYLNDRSLARDFKLIMATFLGAGRGDRTRAAG